MRLLAVLLRLLPSRFRKEYEPEIVETVSEKWEDAKRGLGRWGRARFWWKEWIAVAHIAYELRRGGSMSGSVGPKHFSGARVEGTWKDLRHAFRSLNATPGFTVVAVLTLGLGVGASTAMFSAVHAILLRPLPYEEPAAIVVIEQTLISDGSIEGGVSAANLSDILRESDIFSAAAIAESHGLKLLENARAVSLRGWLVSEGFLEAIGVTPALGRVFRPEEFQPGNERVVLLSHATWQTRFGADPAILERELLLDGSRYDVIGVLPRGFDYPSAAALWGPRPPQPRDERTRARGLDAIARLAPGITLERAQAELDQLASGLETRHAEANRNLELRARGIREHLFGDVALPLTLLFGAVGLVLMTASANVAGLQLAKGAVRSREYALRGALGASGWRLLRLVIVESGIVSIAGAIVGIGIAFSAISAIRRWGPVDVPRLDELVVDGAVLAFAVGAAVTSSVLSGMAPALRASRMKPASAMGGAAGRPSGFRSGRLRDRLVIAQIGAALVLTIGAGLLLKSLAELSGNELGFDPGGRFVFQVWAYDDAHRSRLEFFERAAEAMRSLPDVASVGLTTNLPFADDRSVAARRRLVRFRIDDRPTPSRRFARLAELSVVDRYYSIALGIRLREGRHFTAQDHERSRRVAVVNDAFVRRYFPDRTPVGTRITLSDRDSGGHEVIGVLADTRREGLASEPTPEIYLSLSQEPSNGLTFVVHTTAVSEDTIAAIQETMWSVDPAQAMWASRPMTSLVSDWSRQRRFNTALLTAFAAVSLSLVVVGVFGLMSFSVERRVSELGIRRALGGQSSEIVRMVLADGLALAVAGVSFGLLGAALLSRALESMLFGVEPFEPTTYAVLTLLVVAVALVAAFIPALRAARVDPLEALRPR